MTCCEYGNTNELRNPTKIVSIPLAAIPSIYGMLRTFYQNEGAALEYWIFGTCLTRTASLRRQRSPSPPSMATSMLSQSIGVSGEGVDAGDVEVEEEESGVGGTSSWGESRGMGSGK